MVKVDKQSVLDIGNPVDLFHQNIVVLIKLIDLPADFRVFIGIERRDARLGRTEGFPGKSCLLKRIKKNMIRHHDLCSVGNHDLRLRNALAHNVPEFSHEFFNIKCYAGAHDIHDVLMKNTGRNRMKRKLAILVHNCMAGIRASLKADDNVCAVCQRIRDLPFSFVAPVGTDYCFNHFVILL